MEKVGAHLSGRVCRGQVGFSLPYAAAEAQPGAA